MILLIGLAVGVDYSMFYLRREREEREAGRSEEAALAAAAATSGRAVMVSGFTVIIAMAGMYLAGTPTFHSFATGTILVVAVAVVGSLTVLPAILSWLGDRVEKGGVPIIKHQPWNAGESGALVADPQPGPAPSGGFDPRSPAGCWSPSRFPALSLHTANQSVESLPQDICRRSRPTTSIQDAFPGGADPGRGRVSADNVPRPQVGGAIADLRKQAAASPLFEQPITIDTSPDRTVAQVEHPARRRRHRRAVERRAGRAARRRSSRRRSERCRARRPT